ncbi:MAG: hypothetical protein MUC36_24600 [Planctomycetes bacterium]|jgi:hypothetical protein|nr:hypothetical protein [Planctomycetota bacterium]
MLERRSLVVSLLTSATLAVALTAQKPASATQDQLAAFQQGPAWRELLDGQAGSWRIEWCAATGTPKAIWGSGIALADWRENSLAEARRHAHQLLRDRAALLKLGDSEFREVIGSRMSRTWTFTFDQYYRGLPVIGGRADVRVHMVGRVPMFGSTAWQIPAGFDTTPRFDADTALAMAWQALGEVPSGARQPAAVAPPRLVIWGDVEAKELSTVRLAWEVAISNIAADGSGKVGRYYLDAATGAVLRYENDKHECGFAGCGHGTAAAPTPAAPPILTTVTVRGWTRTGNDGFSALVNVPLPGLQLTVPGIGAVTTDNNGQFTINIVSPVSIAVGNLDGRHHASINGAAAPSGSFTVNPGVATTIQLLTAGATFNEAAHTTTSWWTDRTNEWCRTILGNSPELATADNIGVTVNIASTCNAFYTGNSMSFYSAGGSCNNTAFSTVVAHEWGHGLDDRYGGISQTNGLSEGWGDICGCYQADSPILGSGFSTAGVGIRDGNNTRQYPTGGGVHAQGESWMGFAWKLRERLATTLGNRPAAIALTEDIVVSTIAADATNQADAVREVFIADDNDGNLANGTPNSADLIWACNQHSLPYPGLPSSVPNDDCATALPVANGLNGPYTNTGALSSSPSWPCGNGGSDVWFVYNVGQAGTLTASTCGQASHDTTIEIFSGSCAALTSLGCNDDTCALQSTVSVPVAPGTHYIRVGGYNSAMGPFSLDVNGPAGVPAATAPFGTGCYRSSRSFYESLASAAFDLGNSSMRLVRNPAGFYVAQAGGTYVAPTAAATILTLLDDSFQTVALTGTLQYPGGSTSSLEICSNGFVSPATGNGNAWTPVIAAWLASPQARWGTWHDFNPTIAGSGKVKFQQIGNVAYVTWDGVYSHTTTNANTWQLQFDLTTGNVTYVWQTMVASGNAWLVGFAAQGASADLGSVDITAALPATFRTGTTDALPLVLGSTLPQLGSTLTLTTTQFPASSALGIQILSTTRLDPGIDLTAIGMPGCLQHAGLDSLNLLVPTAGSATFPFPIPNNPSLNGFQLTAQSAAFVSGVNAAGLITSNGVALTVGF